MKYVYLLRLDNTGRYTLWGVYADEKGAREVARTELPQSMRWFIERWEVKSSLPVPPAEQPDTCPHAPRADISPDVAEDADRPDILII